MDDTPWMRRGRSRRHAVHRGVERLRGGSAVSVALTFALLAALVGCGGVAPAAGFTVELPDTVTLTAGDTAGTPLHVKVTYGATYDQRVRVSANTATAGLHVLRSDDARPLAQAPVTLSGSGTVNLDVVADADAQTTNAYVVISAIGVDANGNDAGLPRHDMKVVFTFTP